MNEAATNIENARGLVIVVTAPNGCARNRGRTLDCSARPGRNPSCTEPPKSRFKESARVRMEGWQEAFSSQPLSLLRLLR